MKAGNSAPTAPAKSLDPQKSFPRAFLLGSLILVVLYLVAVVAYLVALGPAAAIGQRRHRRHGAPLRPRPLGRQNHRVTILISTFSATNSVILTAPRVFYAMANDNLFFKSLAEVHPRFRTPAVAIIALGVWSAVLACGRKIRGTDRRRHLHRLDFLRPRRRGHLPHPPRHKKHRHPLPRPRLSRGHRSSSYWSPPPS